MKGQWYRSALTKGLLILMAHVTAVTAAVCLVWILSLPVLWEEMLSGRLAEKYEDSSGFDRLLKVMGYDVLNGIRVKGLFEADGAYYPQKVIDIQKYYTKGLEGLTAPGEDPGSLSYTLGDLIAWGESASYNLAKETDAVIYETGDGLEDRVIVCRRSDKTFHYYYYSEFKRLIDSNELSFVIAGGDSGISEDEILSELRNGSFLNASEAAFKGLQDAEGKIVYIDCWSYDGTWFEEKYKTVNGESIMQMANDSPEWNGRLNEAYTMLYDVINLLRDEYHNYLNFEENYKEGDTNLAYLYADVEKGKIYTNQKEFKSDKKLEGSLDKFRSMGRYMIVSPRLKDFETNLDHISVDEWRTEARYAGGNDGGFVYAIGVDTDYPIRDVFYTEAKVYEAYAPYAKNVALLGLVSGFLLVVALIWLTVAAGRNGQDNEVHLNWFDNWKTEPAAAAVVLAWAVPILLFAQAGMVGILLRSVTGSLYMVSDMSAYPYGTATEAGVIGAAIAAYTCALFLTGYLSLVRRLKAGCVWKNSLLRGMKELIRYLFRNVHAVWKVVAVFGVFVLVHWIVILSYRLSYRNRYALVLMLAGEAAVLLYMVRQVVGRQRINVGVERIAGGEVDYKISLDGLGDEQRRIAERINSIGQGLDAALEKSIKSERLKTDLITNVSHDIKTPLTSIINYVKLLKQEEFEDPKIMRYLDILDEKSQRLKTLTEDVVEASKVSSGNITLEYMNINLVEIIQQTSGEFEEKFKANELTEIMSLPQQEVIIRADGRRLWRVLANIYSNAAKYAMRGTRVYADLCAVGDSAVFSLKNTSDQPLNISADELTERFIRGDISRGTEGSGLGLSIAKTLTEMQGGNFELYLDGDLFRVTMTFPLLRYCIFNENHA